MFPNKVFNLYLSKSRINFRDEYGNRLSTTDIIGDYADPIISNDKYCPDFYLKGFFRKIDHNLLTEFIISNQGPQVLFVTGVPLEANPLERFKFKGIKYSSFYRDDVKGVLFQILDKSPSYIGISKSQGVKQFNI